eukprot:4375618-Pyramimonas_sp.AAC.1
MASCYPSSSQIWGAPSSSTIGNDAAPRAASSRARPSVFRARSADETHCTRAPRGHEARTVPDILDATPRLPPHIYAWVRASG